MEENSEQPIVITIGNKGTVKLTEYGHALINEDFGLDVMITSSGIYITGCAKEDTLLHIRKASLSVMSQSLYNVLTNNEFKKKAEWLFESSGHSFDGALWTKIKLNNNVSQ